MLSFTKMDLKKLSTLQLIVYWLIQVVAGKSQRSNTGSASIITSRPPRPNNKQPTLSTESRYNRLPMFTHLTPTETIVSNIITPNNTPDPNKLAAMQMVAKMRAAADKAGIPFVGGLIAPDGSKFMMNNLDDDDDAINRMLPDSLKDS